jgi:hypothetical protein
MMFRGYMNRSIVTRRQAIGQEAEECVIVCQLGLIDHV